MSFYLQTRNSLRGFARFCQSVRWSMMIELISVKTRIFDAAIMFICVCGVGEGLDRGCICPLVRNDIVTFCLSVCLTIF